MKPKPSIQLCSEQDALDLIASGMRGCVLMPDDLHPEFFDLRNGIAGAIFQKLINYSFRVAIVVPEEHSYGERVTELIRDHSSHECIRFFSSIDPDSSKSITRPWRSELRWTSISPMIFGRVSASDSMAPVRG